MQAKESEKTRRTEKEIAETGVRHDAVKALVRQPLHARILEQVHLRPRSELRFVEENSLGILVSSYFHLVRPLELALPLVECLVVFFRDQVAALERPPSALVVAVGEEADEPLGHTGSPDAPDAGLGAPTLRLPRNSCPLVLLARR